MVRFQVLNFGPEEEGTSLLRVPDIRKVAQPRWEAVLSAYQPSLIPPLLPLGPPCLCRDAIPMGLVGELKGTSLHFILVKG